MPVRVSVSAGAHIWEQPLGPDRPAFLAHHRVQGAVVVPASLYAALALEAARALEPANPRLRLESFTLAAGLALTDARVLQTVIEPDELLSEVIVPPVAAGTRTAYLKFLPRTADDYATIAAAAPSCEDVRDRRSNEPIRHQSNGAS